MESVLERLPSGARVSVIRLRSLGDCVLTTPALQLLREHRPDLEVALVVEDRFRDVFDSNPDVDHILAPKPAGIAAFHPELALNFHGGTRSLALTLASRARWRAGFGHYRGLCSYNIRIPRAQDILGVDRKVHTAEHLASAMFYLGVPEREIPRARLFAEPAARGESFAVVHPFAALPDKVWPGFRQIAAHLAEHGPRPVILAGPGDDVQGFEQYEVIRSAPLGEVAGLLKAASLFVGNDSGPAHMAAACGTPLVVLFGGASDAVVWAPWKAAAARQMVRERISDIAIREVVEAVEWLKVRA
jgi:ADP-heptose:LPS heptosyltransferase